MKLEKWEEVILDITSSKPTALTRKLCGKTPSSLPPHPRLLHTNICTP